MQIGFLGDLHGNTAAGRFMLWSMWKQGVTIVFHVGDFGIYSDNPGMKFASAMSEYAKKFGIVLIVVPGNHENWRIINEMVGDNRIELAKYRENIYIAPRGWRGEFGGMSFVALGGAPSVDRKWRREDDAARKGWNGKEPTNLLWYWQEQITGADVDYTVAGGYADVMVCHDAPNGIQGIDSKIRGNPHGFHISDILYAQEGRDILSEAVRGVAPRFFYHGHYHFPVLEHIRAHNDIGWTYVIGLDCEFNNYSTAILDTELGLTSNIDHTTMLFQYRKDNFTWPSSS